MLLPASQLPPGQLFPQAAQQVTSSIVVEGTQVLARAVLFHNIKHETVLPFKAGIMVVFVYQIQHHKL